MEQEHLLNLRELICGQPNQVRYVERYNNCKTLKKETLTEHLFFTTFFTLIIANHVGTTLRYPVNVELALTKALLHDIDEQFTGDVIRPVKSGIVSQELWSYSNTKVRKMFSSMKLSDSNVEYLHSTWSTAKDDSIEGHIVKLADFLCVLSYLYQEVESGNKLVMNNVSGLFDYYSKITASRYEVLNRLAKPIEIIVAYLSDIEGGQK